MSLAIQPQANKELRNAMRLIYIGNLKYPWPEDIKRDKAIADLFRPFGNITFVGDTFLLYY